MLIKKLRWTVKRHPFLYKTRFWLLSHNAEEDAIQGNSYNVWNKKEDIPRCFYEVNAQVFKQGRPRSDFELIKQLVSWLNAHTRMGPGLSEPSDKVLKTMLYEKGGVCSDMVQIFNNFCVINNIQVREWGTTSTPFNKDNGGHSFNEVFIKEWQKWVLIDPSWGLLFYDDNKVPLSVIELFQKVRTAQTVSYNSFIKDKHLEASQVFKNYLNADITPFLICGYRNKVYDAYLRMTRPFIPVFIVHFVVYVLGKSYHYKFPMDDYRNIFN